MQGEVGEQTMCTDRVRGRDPPASPLLPFCSSIAEPDWANGDSWIEYKGRGAPPGPEKRRGRPNLTETFQQTSNPYQVCISVEMCGQDAFLKFLASAWKCL